MKPMCKAELRQFIDQVSFMIDDITLFFRYTSGLPGSNRCLQSFQNDAVRSSI